jgi:aminopeptidase
VVSSRASGGEDYLQAMLDLDPGARRLGELGLGLNTGIDQFTGSILYDEKIGGTVHLALGQSYPETGGTNQSALHWDLIVDTRTDGRITADGRVVMQNGQWLVG